MTAYGVPPIQLNQAVRLPDRWGPDLLCQVPRSKTEGEYCLDFGCGNGAAKPLLESFGYKWIGIDMAGGKMTVKCDGHRLPFKDETFSLVVSIAVFEHLYDPFTAVREVYRVLKPGGVFLGTTAFLESFHANSYFHMTHLGVQQLLKCVDFDITRIWPTWNFAEALSSFWIPAELPVLHKVFAKSARLMANGTLFARTHALSLFLKARGKHESEIHRRIENERLTWAGSIGFYARKKEESC